eukprot:jgi/Chrzof1/8256/Cz03g03110.t1
MIQGPHFMRARVERLDGTLYPSVVHNGVTYVVAEPGESFQIQVTRSPNDSWGPEITAYLKVDNRSVGYSKLLREPRRYSQADPFKGFLLYSDERSNTGQFEQFTFAKPPQDTPAGQSITVEHPDQIEAGRLRITLFRSICQGPAHSANETNKNVSRPLNSLKARNGSWHLLCRQVEDRQYNNLTRSPNISTNV